MKRALLEKLAANKAAKIPTALVLDLATGLQTLVTAAGQEGGFGLTEAQRIEALRMLAADVSGPLKLAADDDEELEGAARLFVVAHNPPLRLLVVGAVHIAQPLAAMAALTGYAVAVIDPRAAFATPARFPGFDLRVQWPDEALAELLPDSRTAVAVLSHDPKLDDPALIAALNSPAFYVGALGSRRTHAKRIDRLRAAGVAENRLARIHAPIGLGINALTPAEIAVAIMAQVTAVRRRPLD
ncbi:MAG TPA: XdhC family protein [Azospirillaceae bacterium]|nr:XdhC family protein [Azospirillaceae bacterium]